MSTVYEVFNSESPGVRVFVRRTNLQQIMKILSNSAMFAGLREKTLTNEQVDEYVSLIPIDSRVDIITDDKLMNATPDEKHPAYLLSKSIPTAQVVGIFEALFTPMALQQLRLLSQMVFDPSGKTIEALKGFLIGLRLVNAINETTFLTLRYGVEIHLDSFKQALDNVILRKS